MGFSLPTSATLIGEDAIILSVDIDLIVIPLGGELEMIAPVAYIW